MPPIADFEKVLRVLLVARSHEWVELKQFTICDFVE